MKPVDVIKWERLAVLKVVEEEVCRESLRRGVMVTSSDPVVVNHVTQYIFAHGEELRKCAEAALSRRSRQTPGPAKTLSGGGASN